MAGTFRRKVPATFLGILLSWQLAAPKAAVAQPPPPRLAETVNDFAHIVDADSRSELDKRIRALRQATGDTIVIATVQTYKPFGSIDEYAVKMFENGGRGIGDAGKDNGLLIVVAVDDRALRLEVGYGLEGLIPDGFAGRVRDAIRPEFRQGRYGPGLLLGTTLLINRIGQQRGVEIPDVPVVAAQRAEDGRQGGFPLGLIFIILIAVLLISRHNRPRRRRYWGSGPWSGWTGGVGPFGGGGFGSGGIFGGGSGGFGGGSGGGGFGGFGGGRSGGGGASGSW